MFLNKSCKKIKTHFTLSNFFFENCAFYENVEDYGGAKEDADNMAPARGIVDE